MSKLKVTDPKSKPQRNETSECPSSNYTEIESSWDKGRYLYVTKFYENKILNNNEDRFTHTITLQIQYVFPLPSDFKVLSSLNSGRKSRETSVRCRKQVRTTTLDLPLTPGKTVWSSSTVLSMQSRFVWFLVVYPSLVGVPDQSGDKDLHNIIHLTHEPERLRAKE